MSKRFLSTDMINCPPFTSDYKWGKVKFLYATSGINVYMIEDEDGSYIYGDLENPFMCKPEDRMRAICKNLFELMPDMTEIHYDSSQSITKATNGLPYYNDFKRFCYISINPFLHTGITEITREQIEYTKR